MIRALIWSILIFFLPLFISNCLAADEITIAEDVNTLAELGRITVAGFYEHTFDVRMRREFAGEFFSENDRKALYELSQNTSEQLADIISNLQQAVTKIEQYDGADWQERFGETGLYNKAADNLFNTRLSKANVDFYTALASEKNNILSKGKELIGQIESFRGNPYYLGYVKGRTLNLLAKTDPNYTASVEKVFSELRERSDTEGKIVFLASIEELNLNLPNRIEKAKLLVRELGKGELENEMEIVLPLAFKLRRLGLVDAYNELLMSNAAARVFCARVTLDWLEGGKEAANQIDASLAAEGALLTGPEKHKQLLLKLANENVSASPIVDYAAAVTLIDDSDSQAVYLLMRASKVLDKQSADILGFNNKDISALAAKLAYREFVREPNQCETAGAAFENYFSVAGESPDPSLAYIYTQVLVLCGENQRAVEILRGIPASSGSLYSRAQLDLMIAGFAAGQGGSITDRASDAERFYEYLKDANDCIYSGAAERMIGGYLEDIEEMQDEKSYNSTITSSRKIARFIYDCTADCKSASLLAEFTALDADSNNNELADVNEILSGALCGENLDAIRARARLAQRMGDFAEAARLWARVARVYEFAQQQERPWQWWRAKYEQLGCGAAAGEDKEQIKHAIDVLIGSFKDIPAVWEKRLKSLAERLD